MNEETKNFLFNRQLMYQGTFQGPGAETVLEDLAKFCRAKESTFDPDSRLAANLDGRREVWLRIQDHLNLNSEDLLALYGGKQYE